MTFPGLWQKRFYSCALDEAHFEAALRYVERNTVRTKLVRAAWTYAWSSAAAHVGQGDSTGLLDLAAWWREYAAVKWKQRLASAEDDAELEKIRVRTHTGRPLGTDAWVSKLEVLLNRRLRPLPVGQPKKELKRKMK